MSTPSIVIASAARTTVGTFNGAFANTQAHELGAAVVKGVLDRASIDAREVDEVILGQALARPVRARTRRASRR
ncbi:acetyl-CoA acetyltransferase [Sinorhizobium kostiense]|uniref:Acetyl-CoA acetyltransferase n=1 Tax=Sinorhizobium kostiense TaxID=76747 RepID=A0ABS4R9M3_9HYPH|nr:acetyl-CoA acetyltransferase [Sinorhizobium kostiense]